MHTPRNGTRLVTSKRLAIIGPNGEPEYLLGVIEDITEKRCAEERIAHLAQHDPLTDLPNRAAFNAHLDAVLARAVQSSEPFALLAVDLDRFKEVNDVFGHAVGDALLCGVAARMKAAAEGAFVARLGGDEFTVICEIGPQPATAEGLAERLQAAVAGDIEIAGHQLRVGLSIGVAIFPTDGNDATMLLGNADAALYRTKAEGRGQPTWIRGCASGGRCSATYRPQWSAAS
jgi:diguanylate cyclase (GGDEF)-like protein